MTTFQLRDCAANGGKNANGLQLVDFDYDRRYKTLLKKYVGYVESQSNVHMVITKDNIAHGQISVQFYGLQVQPHFFALCGGMGRCTCERILVDVGSLLMLLLVAAALLSRFVAAMVT